jgi:hypothetical protein
MAVQNPPVKGGFEPPVMSFSAVVGARGACRGRVRRALEREGGGVDGPGRLRPVGRKGGARPSKQKIAFSFLFSNPDFSNSFKF